MKRYAYFISDGTGITAETLGNALLAQFDKLQFIRVTLPYIDSTEKANAAVSKINQSAKESGAPAILFDTIIDKNIRAIIDTADVFKIDIFETFLQPLEQELATESSYSVGKSHSPADSTRYLNRIDAVNFALDNDDGARTRHYQDADVILVGVSRSGKTPTCLYLAMQFGIKAANYPLTEEDMLDLRLPDSLQKHKHKIFGLTIDPERLAAIRTERKANSRYASLKQCYHEVDEVEFLYERENIPFISTTDKSIEEISTRILETTGLKRTMD
ncbi:MAG: phosphoenolpyruvate synthase regulatory protein [Thalassolituus sp.]|jgi:regulator of PEP synthase PpsR (kinase-PPPase family)|uniref:Putative phosphoenolpyruvate synthase regulatory protein n=2 Tax=Thalassolituus TaxID=187492 RepID=A0ABP9ZZ44_9GAMM|nr:pyruvate, water dikinase regulatory protein [Pseudomonadota bacterium]MEC8104013.1 pyruvate, water dikinase regulatory protein [Pseudomonadota bacterium]MEC8523944.1 pyruvate, water dikinase regulatory protein [Pseudomonadota bacterium]TNC85080.1 MAG: phosphoenolpyruvate synthase regulatory protein [Thalassolituus sp.]|tara:strand:- start:34 stop:852 length:819 start_codon:yes stop_codon:yes gene_type:complete